MKNLFLLLFTTFFLLSMTTGCAAMGPWRGKVIDAETKKPIEGAVVVAVFHYRTITPVGGSDVFLDAKETTTNTNGQFEIPTQRYLSIPLFRDVQKTIDFTIYKPGYDYFPEAIAPKTKNAEEINSWVIKYDRLFKEKEDIVELPVMKSNQERREILSNLKARISNIETKPKILKKLIDSEENFLRGK